MHKKTPRLQSKRGVLSWKGFYDGCKRVIESSVNYCPGGGLIFGAVPAEVPASPPGPPRTSSSPGAENFSGAVTVVPLGPQPTRKPREIKLSVRNLDITVHPFW